MVSGTLSQNGVQYSGSWTQSVTGANMVLQTPSGDQAALGTTHLGTYARYVIAGTYELMYEFSGGSFQIPYNTMADLGCYGVP